MEQKQNAKRRGKIMRIGLIVLAAVMLLCGSYWATVAYLHLDSGDPLVNTFSHPTTLAMTFTLQERVPKDTDENDLYDDGDFQEATVYTETYLFAPGVTLAKRPYVTITELKEPAYLFVEYTGLTESLSTFKWEFDGSENASYWEFVPNTGNRLIYVYVGERADGILLSGNYEVDIIKEDSVKVAHDVYDIMNPTANDSFSLTFKAYLVQAIGFTNAEAAWKASGF